MGTITINMKIKEDTLEEKKYYFILEGPDIKDDLLKVLRSNYYTKSEASAFIAGIKMITSYYLSGATLLLAANLN